MQFGVYMFPTDYSMEPVELGRALEERAFESLFVPEHTHIPASRETPFPGGGELPKEYSHTLDPFVTLAAVAAATSRLKVATGICLVVERDPIVLAKEVASLDHLSNGRFLFGVGGGWNREEMRNHGTDPATRWDLLRERVEAMQAIWTHDEASYSGKFVHFDRIWSWPKPVQQPYPPVLVGGNGPSALERVLTYGDEWMPINRGDETHLGDRINELRDLAEQRGVQPPPVSLFGASPKPEALERYAQMGLTRCVLPLPPAPRSETLPRLDRYAALAAQFAHR